MAHYAELNAEGEVIDVLFVSNDVITDENGEEVEQLGIDHLHTHHGADRIWVQTSYNANFRGNYAYIGGTYRTDVRTLGEESTDIFINPKPFVSWVIHEMEARWTSPVGDAPELTEEQEEAEMFYLWDEEGWQQSTRSGDATGWVLVTEATASQYLN